MRERETERDRERQRETERDRERERDRQSEMERDRARKKAAAILAHKISQLEMDTPVFHTTIHTMTECKHSIL